MSLSFSRNNGLQITSFLRCGPSLCRGRFYCSDDLRLSPIGLSIRHGTACGLDQPGSAEDVDAICSFALAGPDIEIMQFNRLVIDPKLNYISTFQIGYEQGKSLGTICYYGLFFGEFIKSAPVRFSVSPFLCFPLLCFPSSAV